MSYVPDLGDLRGRDAVNRAPRVLLESFARSGDTASYAFSELLEEVAARTPEEVLPALRRVEEAVSRGLHAAGFISYEAAAGLAPGLSVHPPCPLPLLWFGIFRQRLALPRPESGESPPDSYGTSGWHLSLPFEEYRAAVGTIREYIAGGDTYQVNLTLRRRFRLQGSPLGFYRDLCRAQSAPFCAFIDIGPFQIVSASPELFFRLKGGTLTARPMKGTARRGRWHAEDEEAKRSLRESAKERAENLMIVDLLRNDMGMVSETGSVRVESLFDVETLETVHQMTSTITSRLKTGVGIPELFRALFPCGSVTGAPKRRTMEIIRELEDCPRGPYTGCIGYISPSEKANSYEAVFSVAIRTAVIDGATGEGEMGVGSGITWDSIAEAEYEECQAKGRFARRKVPEFQLIESLLHEEGTGYFLLERHLERLCRSAAYFAFTLDPDGARQRLAEFAAPLTGSRKVRLLLSREGGITLEAAPISAQSGGRPGIAFAGTRVDSADPFLYHKTTNRPLYTAELARRPDLADVIFLNERGEVTEGANSNIVVRLHGMLVTPPTACGLLPGTFREELLEKGTITERVITKEELERAEEIYLVNSVRRWRRVKLVV